MLSIRRLYTTLIGILCFCATAAAQVFSGPIRYVRENGSYTNDGTSWDKAKNNLQDAIESLNSYMKRNGIPKGRVYVAAGTYAPTTSTPGGDGVLYTSFLIYEGITLYGGFDATAPEARPEDRKLEDGKAISEAKGKTWKLKNVTTLSGNHSSSAGVPLTWNAAKNEYDEAFTGNSYHVVWFATNTSTHSSGLDARNRAVPLNREAGIDGFTIREGNSSNRTVPEASDGAHAYHNSYGGGVYMVANSVVRNCVIKQNASSLRGGGVYMDGGGLLEQCYVAQNQSDGVGVTDGYGGGVACDDGGIVRHCVIENNAARCGGGLSISFSSVMTDEAARYASYAAGSIVSNNTSSAEAGGVFLHNGGLLNHLTITYNKCVGAGVVYNNRRYGRSGGLFVDGGGMVANSVIWGNEVAANNNVQYSTYRENASIPKVRFDFVALSRYSYVDWSGTVKRANGVYSLSDKNSDGSAEGYYPEFQDALPDCAGVVGGDDTHASWIPMPYSFLRHQGMQLNDFPDGANYDTQGSHVVAAHVPQDIDGKSFAPRCALGAMVADSPAGADAWLTSLEGGSDLVRTVFVDPSTDAVRSDDSDKGSSWETAFNNVNDAMDYVGSLILKGDVTADAPVQIVVKEGTATVAGNSYLPHIRSSYIDIKSHVRLYGSFASHLAGTDLSLRDPMEYPTRITANITGGEYEDNACHIVTIRHGVSDVVVDGFQLYFANAVPNNVMPKLALEGGAGLAVINSEADKPMTDIKIRNCIVANCTASQGTALFLRNTPGALMEVDVENCIFHNNAVTQDGAAVVEATGSNATLNLNHCLIRGNVGYGVLASDHAVVKVKNTALHANVKLGSSSANLKITDLTATADSPDLKVVTFASASDGEVKLGEGATAANNMMDLGVSDAVATAVATPKFSYHSSYVLTYPKFVNPTSNIGVNREGDVTTYGGDPEWMPTNMNPMVNAATDESMSGTDLTGDVRSYGGRADIGAVENSDLPAYGTVIYVRDYRKADGTIDYDRDGDGSSWQNAINGNLESDKYKNNHSFAGVDAELYEEGYQLTGLQWAVDEAFARSLERNEYNSIKYTTISGVTHFNPGNQSTVNTNRTTIDVSAVDKSKRVQVWIGEGEYIRREGFFMRDAVDVYGGFPGKGGSPQSPGMKERVPKTSILETLTNDEVTETGVTGTGEWGPQVDDYAHHVLPAYTEADITNTWTVVDFSSDDAEGNAPACIDENTNTFWHSRWQDNNAGHGTKNGGLPQWIIIDMGQAYDITSLKITNRNYTPNNYTIGYASSYTDDGVAQSVVESAFTLIWENKDVTPATLQTLDFAQTISCRYLYVKVNSNSVTQKFVDIKEIEAYNGSTKIEHITDSRVQNNVYDLNSYAKAYKTQRVLTQPYPYFKGTKQINGSTSGQNLEFDNDPLNPFSVVTSWDGFVIRNGRTKITHQRDGGAGVALRINGRLANCVITNNILSSPSNTRGGGIFQNGGIIENCEIDGNVLNGEVGTDVNVFGGGLYQRTGTVFNTSVINNKITGKGKKQGAGVFFENGRFYNNTITANEGPYTLYSGKWFSNGRIDVYNSIIFNNTTTEESIEFDCTTEADKITLKNCLFKNSSSHKTFGSSYKNVDVSSFVYMEDKEMSASNLFNDAANGDYSLKRGAIAINMGTDQLGKNMEGTEDIVLPSYDAQYADRIQDCTVDIGAYEFNGAYSITPDVKTSADMAVYYVTQNGRGTGSAADPENAACWTKLQKVLDAAGRYLADNPETTRRVIVKLAGDAPGANASGNYSGFVYRPRRSNKETAAGQEVNMRDFSFIVPHGVEVWGGYSSAFTDADNNGFYTLQPDGSYADNRDVLTNRTTLSGIYQTDGQDVNVYNVVTFTNDTYKEDGTLKIVDALKDVQARAVLDGLFIEDGNADGEKQSTWPTTTRVGGAAIVTDFAHIRNCVVQNNKAADAGGGLYLKEGALVSGSVVQYNEVTKGDGGGIFVEQPIAASENSGAAFNPARIFTSDIIFNTASGAGGGISFTTGASPNVRANSVLFWQNTGSEQPNVNGMTSPTDASGTTLTIEDYPISFCATETTREPGINNIAVNTDMEKGMRFDSESYNHDYIGEGGKTVKRMHNEYEFYKIKKYSLLARGGMDFGYYEDLVSEYALTDCDIASVDRTYEGNDFIDIGARAVGELVLPVPSDEYLMTRIFVVKNEEDVSTTDVEIMQKQNTSLYYQQEGSSFAYPMRYLDDALEYVRDARKLTKNDKYTYADTKFEIFLSGGTYYPMRNIKGEYVNSRGRTYLVPEGVTIVGGVEVKQTTTEDGETYYGNLADVGKLPDPDATKTIFTVAGKGSVAISHDPIKNIIKARKLSDINHNNIAEPWEMAVQTILSGQVVNSSSTENVYHVIACIADENHVGGLPEATIIYDDAESAGSKYDADAGNGSVPKMRGVPVIIDGVEIEDGMAMGYDASAVNSEYTYYKGGAICVEGNWTTGNTFRNTSVNRPVGYRNIPLELRNCNFRNNGGCLGGAIFTDSELKVFACNFVQNYAKVVTEEVGSSSVTYAGRGGAINASYNTVIVNSLFANNEADTSLSLDGGELTGVGGAVLLGEYAALHMINCDVVRNLAHGYPAVYCYEANKGGMSTYPTLVKDNPHKIVNTIFWGNEVTGDSGMDMVANFGSDKANPSKNAEMLWFCAYEKGKGNAPVNSAKGVDYRLQPYSGFGTYIPQLWTGYYNKLGSDGTTITPVAEPNPDTDAATGLNPVTCNIIIDSDNDAINGPNFINPSSKAGRAGYYTSADWMIGRINNIVDNGWTFLQQNLDGDEPTFEYADIEQDGKTRNQVVGAGIYRRTAYDYVNVNTEETAVPIGNDPYMAYADGTEKAMLRISHDPNPTHHQTYIDLGVYEYQHVKLSPDEENGHVDVLWVTQQERISSKVADGKTWETATSDMQRAIETLLASHNGHDKEIRMLEGRYQPVYTINGNLGFTITTDVTTGIEPPDGTGTTSKGVNSLTIRGGYSKDVYGLKNIDDYPVYLFASERSGVEGSLLGHVFVIGDMRQRKSSGISTGESDKKFTTVVTDYVVPVYLEGLTFCNVKSAPHKDIESKDCYGGAAVFYKDQKIGEEELAQKSYVTEKGESVTSAGGDTYTQYTISNSESDFPLYKLTINRCDFRINGATSDVPAVTIGKGGGEALVCNSVFHSNLGKPLVATDTKVINCTFALNGGVLEFGADQQGTSEMHNSVLWLNNGYKTAAEWTGLDRTGSMSFNAVSSLKSDDEVNNNVTLSANNNDVLHGPNFFNPRVDITGNTVSDSWLKATRDFRVNPSAKIIGKASPRLYVEHVKDLSGRYPYKSRLAGTDGSTDEDYEDMVKQDSDLVANTRCYGSAGMERGAYECIAALSRVLYVNPSRESSSSDCNGFSWEKAYTKGNLQTAIDAAAVYSNVNGDERSYVFVKGMPASTGETLAMRNHVSLYGSLPSTTAIDNGVEETVLKDGSKVYEDKNIEAYIKMMDSERDGMASPYSLHTIVNGVRSTEDVQYCLFDGLEIGSGDNSTVVETASPVVDLQHGNVALRNSIIANNRISVAGLPLVNVQSGLLYNTLVRDNTMASSSDALVTLGLQGFMLNCTVEGGSGQSLVSGYESNSINNILHKADDLYMPFAPYFRPSSLAYHSEMDKDDVANRNLWYQLHEHSVYIEGGSNGTDNGKSHVADKLQDYIDYSSDRDILGNPRLIGSVVDRGCFETWSTGSYGSIQNIHANALGSDYNGHRYPHDGSVVYLQGSGNLICEVQEDGSPFFTDENPLRPGYLLAMEGGSLYGQGNSVKLRYVAAEHTVSGRYALVSLPFDMDYKAKDGSMAFVTTTSYAQPDDHSDFNVIESAVNTFACRYYDGEKRSGYDYVFKSDDSDCWKPLTATLRSANDGILIDRGSAAPSSTLRFTAYGESAAAYPYQEDGTPKKVVLDQYDERTSSGGADFTSVYNMGWNLKGMPYLISGYRLYDTADDGKRAMHAPHVVYTMSGEGNYSPRYSWDDSHACIMSPGDAFFTQTATIDAEENLYFCVPSFSGTSSLAVHRPVLKIYGAGYGQDEVIIMPAEDAVTDEYIFGSDAVKIAALNDTLPQLSVKCADGATLSLLSHAPVRQLIPLSLYVKGDGDYTFSLPEKDAFLDYGSVHILDSANGVTTNLMSSDYTTNISASDSPSRFSLIIGGSASDIRDNTPQGVYTVSGLRLNRPNGRGIYIIDGKRRVVE